MDFKQILGGVIGSLLTILSMYIFNFIGNAKTFLIPPQAVVAFDGRKCPDDTWEPFSELAGKIIVGSGKSPTLTERKYGQSGGTEYLTDSHLPIHNHTIDRFDGDDSTGGRSAAQGGDAQPHKVVQNGLKTSSYGAKIPNESMPPYLVLTYCIKKK